MTTPPEIAARPGLPGSETDQRWMRAARALGRRGLGVTWPNPSVGCVLVDFSATPAGRLISQGWTQAGGRPHAEAVALAAAAVRDPGALRGATAYVTLEPCAHHGRTPPCADALISAGIARVVYAIGDPDPRVAGRGRERLAAGGVAVDTGVLAAEIADDLQGYLRRQREGRASVTLKLAASLDGRIATASGESRWITDAPARARAHLLRVESDAIIVGVGTALADDPGLDVRLPGLVDRSPLRIVADTHARLPLGSRLAGSARDRPLWILHGPSANTDPDAVARAEALRRAGAELICIPLGADGRLDLRAALTEIGARGVGQALCEGGGQLAAGLLAADRVDRLIWASAGLAIGAEGRPAVGGLAIASLAAAPRFRLHREERAGPDIWAEWRPVRTETR